MEESVGDPGHETGGETEKGGLLCTDVDAEEEGEEGTSVLVSPSTAPTVLWGFRPRESSMSSLVREGRRNKEGVKEGYYTVKILTLKAVNAKHTQSTSIDQCRNICLYKVVKKIQRRPLSAKMQYDSLLFSCLVKGVGAAALPCSFGS